MPKPAPRRTEIEEPAWMVSPARDMSPHVASTILFAGPPKTGKSTAMAGMCVEGPTLLIATLQREVTSWGYQQMNPDKILLDDRGWRPLNGQYEATAFTKSLAILQDLAEDDYYRVVLFDNGTEWGEFAWHEALKSFKVSSPGDMEDRDNRFRPYVMIADYMAQGINALLALKTAPLPKHVGISWHLQPTKEDQVVFDKSVRQNVKKLSSDTRSEGVQYEGNVLPMLQGGFRRKIAGLMDGVVYTDVLHEFPTTTKGQRVPGSKKVGRFVLQVLPDEERHAGLPGAPATEKYIYCDPKDITSAWKQLKALFPKEAA